ncbi:MAG: M23 family metallopeptidase [Egibacteraceae bacterium]
MLWIAAFSFGWAVTAASTQDDPVADGSRTTPMAAAAAVLPKAPDANSPALLAGSDRLPPDVALREVSRNPVFASVRRLRLMLPHPNPILVAFHEASKPEALALGPVGHLVANDNPSQYKPGPNRPGPGYRVLSSRGRGRPPTSAVDIVVPKRALIAAPVSGRVAEVRQYPLYGRTLDWRVAIEPTGHPGFHVVLIHLEQPRVAVGDKVVAGQTAVALVRQLGFTSQVDYVTNQHLPHTHIEVKPAPEA